MQELVAIDDLAARCGYGHESLRFEQIVRELTGADISGSITRTWDGLRGVPVEVAAETYGAVTAAIATHDARWVRYQRYIEDRAERARLARVEARRKDAEQVEVSHQKFSAKAAEEAQRRAEKHMREEAEKARRRAGTPVRFDDFESRHQPLLERS